MLVFAMQLRLFSLSLPPYSHYRFHPVCLRICASFSFLGSGSRLRFARASSRFSLANCLACFSVGRRMDQFNWPKMLVLIAVPGLVSMLRGGSSLANVTKLTIDAIRAQEVHSFDPPTGGACVQRGDVFQSFAGQEALSFLAIGRLLFGHRLEQAIPYVGPRRD